MDAFKLLKRRTIQNAAAETPRAQREHRPINEHVRVFWNPSPSQSESSDSPGRLCSHSARALHILQPGEAAARAHKGSERQSEARVYFRQLRFQPIASFAAGQRSECVVEIATEPKIQRVSVNDVSCVWVKRILKDLLSVNNKWFNYNQRLMTKRLLYYFKYKDLKEKR